MAIDMLLTLSDRKGASLRKQYKDEGKHVTISPTADDIAVLRELIHAPMCSEHFEKDTYLNQLIPKPWGYEHRVYADNIYDVWTLNIRSGGRTSLHCHPRKDTTLLCLAGTGVFKTLIQERRIRQGDYLHIRKGAFHSTQNSGISMLELLEVESPRNKLDLIRISDTYGRINTTYETSFEAHRSLLDMNPVTLKPDARLRTNDLENKYAFWVHNNGEHLPRASWLASITISMDAFLMNETHGIVTNDVHTYCPTHAHELWLSIYRNTI